MRAEKNINISSLDLCRCFSTEISNFEAFDDVIDDVISHDCFAISLFNEQLWMTTGPVWMLLLFPWLGLLTRSRFWLGNWIDSIHCQMACFQFGRSHSIFKSSLKTGRSQVQSNPDNSSLAEEIENGSSYQDVWVIEGKII